MGERRTLVEAMKPDSSVDRTVEEEFVFSSKPKSSASTQPQPPAPVIDIGEGKGHKANSVSRVPLTTRIRGDFSEALKRASFERQLQKVSPHTLQDILEQALEPWLRSNGYLS